MTYAYANCPFYHKLYRLKGFVPSEVRTMDDFRKRVPVITKNDLAKTISFDFTAGILPSRLKQSKRSITMTSGVTGVNTYVVTGPRFIDRFVKSYLSREMWMEMLRPNMRVFLQLCGWHFIAISMNRLAQLFSLKVISPWGTQMYKFSKNYVKLLEESSPEYMVTTPSMLLSILEECRTAGREIHRVFEKVKYISVAGEVLPSLQRSKLVDELGVYDIFESGGSVDGIWGGGECFAHKGHHVWMDHGFLETVDSTGEPLAVGERGALVNTHFSLNGSVYIRFNSQDYGEILDGDCECGRTHCRVEIYDRIMNTVTINSRRISVSELVSCFERVPEVSDALFTIVLSRNGEESILRLKVARSPRIRDTESTEAKLREVIRHRLSIENVRFDWRLPNELEYIHGKIVRIEKESD